MVARACELLSARGAEVCYCAYTYLEDWYAQLGFTLLAPLHHAQRMMTLPRAYAGRRPAS
jgi:hypothetical protein